MKKVKFLVSVFLCLILIGSITCEAASFPEPSYPKITGDVTITWWSWDTNTAQVVASFNKVYPNIHVETPLIGGGSAAYTKFETAVKAGSGAPDVMQIEYPYLPKFIDSGGILDISKYVDSYKSDFPTAVWNLVSQGSKVYAMPQDVGPLGFMYRPDVFAKDGISVPKTYADMASDAAKLHNADPSKYYTFLPLNDGNVLTGLLWQAGAQLFKNNGDTWTVDINSATSKKVMNYWGDLISKGYVKAANDFTPEWESEIGSGLYASMIGAQWAPTYELGPYVKAGTNNWNASDIPQWDSSKFIDGNCASATQTVTTQSKNPAAAALFVSWIYTSQAGVEWTLDPKNGAGVFPANKNFIDLPEFNSPNPNLSNQIDNPIWIKGENTVDPSFQWSPWTDYVFSQMSTEFTKASQGSETWDQALDVVQNNTVSFAKSMGYKIQTGTNAGTSSGSSNKGIIIGVIALAVVIILFVFAFLFRRSKKLKASK